MRIARVFCIVSLCALALSACAGGSTGITLGYGHHGPGIAVFTDNLWYTPHQAGVRVPMGWESGDYAHAPVAPPAAPAVSAAVPAATRPGPAAGPLTGYVEPSPPLAEKAPAAPREKKSGGSPSSSPRLGEVPSALTPPDLSYRP